MSQLLMWPLDAGGGTSSNVHPLSSSCSEIGNNIQQQYQDMFVPINTEWDSDTNVNSKKKPPMASIIKTFLWFV